MITKHGNGRTLTISTEALPGFRAALDRAITAVEAECTAYKERRRVELAGAQGTVEDWERLKLYGADLAAMNELRMAVHEDYG